MLTANELAKYHTGFELTDLFGKGRMRELIYDFRLQIAKDQEEIEIWKSAYLAQASAIKMLVETKTEPSRLLQEENERLKKELKNAQINVDSLQEWAGSLEKKLLVGAKISTNVENWVKEEDA